LVTRRVAVVDGALAAGAAHAAVVAAMSPRLKS
jgi:hypothetical protein